MQHLLKIQEFSDRKMVNQSEEQSFKPWRSFEQSFIENKIILWDFLFLNLVKTTFAVKRTAQSSSLFNLE